MVGGFSSISDLYTKSVTKGQSSYIEILKLANTTTVANFWFDLFQGAGSYSGLTFSGSGTATQLDSSVAGAMPIVNSSVSPSTKWLSKIQATNPQSVPTGTAWLCDLLMYYPQLNVTSTIATPLTNPVSLPRYIDGVGVHCIITNTVAVTVATPTMTFTYTDNNNNSQVAQMQPKIGPIGTLATPGIQAINMPFMNWGSLISPAQGIKSLTSYTISTPATTGQVCALLVKPLMPIGLLGGLFSNEEDYFFSYPSPIQIQDNACLGIIYVGQNSVNSGGQITRFGISCVWG